MRPRPVSVLLCLLISASVFGEPPSVSEEIQFNDRTLAEIQAMKAEIQAIQTRLDALIASFSERRGLLQNAKPAPFGGSVAVPAVADRPDQRPPTVRCAALTKDGTRCTRPAVQGQRYCKQHALAKQK